MRRPGPTKPSNVTGRSTPAAETGSGPRCERDDIRVTQAVHLERSETADQR